MNYYSENGSGLKQCVTTTGRSETREDKIWSPNSYSNVFCPLAGYQHCRLLLTGEYKVCFNNYLNPRSIPFGLKIQPGNHLSLTKIIKK